MEPNGTTGKTRSISTQTSFDSIDPTSKRRKIQAGDFGFVEGDVDITSPSKPESPEIASGHNFTTSHEGLCDDLPEFNHPPNLPDSPSVQLRSVPLPEHDIGPRSLYFDTSMPYGTRKLIDDMFCTLCLSLALVSPFKTVVRGVSYVPDSEADSDESLPAFDEEKNGDWSAKKDRSDSRD